MIRAFTHTVSLLNELLRRPGLVLLLCLGFLFFSLVIEGSLFQWWSLHRDQTHIEQKMAKIRQDSQKLRMKIKHANDPEMIELEARNRLDMVNQGDLIFVFTDDGVKNAP